MLMTIKGILILGENDKQLLTTKTMTFMPEDIEEIMQSNKTK